MSESTGRPRARKAAPDRPRKPYPDFPLTPHASGAWQKKIRGRTFYFGKWARRVNGVLERIPGDGWKEALDLYKSQADDLHAGRTPRIMSDALTVADLCNRFLTAKHRKVESGELGARMFSEYHQVAGLVVGAFGANRPVDDLAADDFEQLRLRMAKRWGPVRLGNAITRVKTIFKYGTDNGLLEKAVRYGSEFRKPDKVVLRRHRAARGVRMIEAADLWKLINSSDGALKAMVLLGANCGFGNADCATLRFEHLDLDRGWVDFPRPKTGIQRRCSLWPETVAAIREAIGARPKPATQADRSIVFLTARGTRWVRDTRSFRSDSLSRSFRELLVSVGLHREGIGFYTLRHVFRTIADGGRDPVAIDLIMGHADHTMGGHYRERVDDSRLRAVVEFVHSWLVAGRAGAGA